MNLVDAVCKRCGKILRWLTGGPIICPECLSLPRRELDETARKLLAWLV